MKNKRLKKFYVLLCFILYEDGSENLGYYCFDGVLTDYCSLGYRCTSLLELAELSVCFDEKCKVNTSIRSFCSFPVKLTSDDLLLSYKKGYLGYGE